MGNMKRQTAIVKRGSRNVRVPKSAPIVIASMDDAFRIAATVTPDTFGATLRMANANHGITHASRNVNRFDSTRIEFTQNATFARNVNDQLTDVQMLFVWAVAFPMATGRVFDVNRATDDATMRTAIINGVRIVNGARATFNAGKHGAPAPASPSVRYGSPKITFAPVAPSA